MEGVTKRSVRISETPVHRLKNKFTSDPEVVEKLKGKLLRSERIGERLRKIKKFFQFKKDGKSYLRVEYA